VHPLDRLPAPRRIDRQQLAGLLAEVLQDRTRLEQAERFAARTCGSMIAGILPFGLSERNSGVFWSSLPKSTRCGSYGRPISSSMIETLTPFGVGSE
jgi:hypothetical protein